MINRWDAAQHKPQTIHGIAKLAQSLQAWYLNPFPNKPWFLRMEMVKPQKLHTVRAKGVSKETISRYFMELETVLKENDLFNAPETGIRAEHSPLKKHRSSSHNLS